MRYLLDTNVVIDYLNKRPRAVKLIDSLSEQGHVLCTCAVVVAEVYSGILPGSLSAATAHEMGDSLRFLETGRETAEAAGIWRYGYARQGIQIATTDALIAAAARSHDAVIITGNDRHFPMPELSLLRLEH